VELPRDLLVGEVRLLFDDGSDDGVLVRRDARRVPPAELLRLEAALLAAQPLPAPHRCLADLEQLRRLLVAHPGAVERCHDTLSKIDRVRPAHRRLPRNARKQKIRPDRSRQLGSAVRDLKQDLDTKVGRLRSLVERLDLIPQAHDAPGGHAATAATAKPDRREAFIVHGHDEAARESVARFLERLGVRPIILHEQANKGQTVIEKFEAHSDVPFAVVLLTPDDVGSSKQAQSSFQPRARQNVIFELGFFIGKLGRARVCALHAEGVELPSDFAGVVYVKMDAGGAWRLALARELKVAGLDVDLNNAI
jgi:predicted nucleotide-binding protein